MPSSSFSAALSALKAQAAAIDATGNNLANLTTTGYKNVDVAFKDVVAAAVNAQSQTGMGVGRLITQRNFSQGAVASSNGPLDAAIQGNGFFVVTDAQGNKTFTRDGSFQLDSSGYVTTLTGQRVQQFTSAGLADIQVPTGSAGATPTTGLSMIANLNATAAVGDVFSTPVEVVDSLGARHTLTFQFTNKAPNSWSWDVFIPAADVGKTGAPVSIFGTTPPSTTIDFDSAGVLTAPAASGSPLALAVTGLADSAADLAINWNLYDSKGAPTMTQFSQSSAVTKIDQNGSASSEITNVGMADGGNVVATFSNGQVKTLGQLAIALVSNPSSLIAVGDNNFTVSGQSAQPVYGVADSGGRGKIKANALEGSTVDIAKEFTNLITFQRAYQANSRVITTADELSQETLNLKR